MPHQRPSGIRLKEQPTAEEAASLAAELDLPQGVAILAWQRGILDKDAWRRFTDLDPAADLIDPRLLPDMDKAVERLQLALERGESLLVHGDYDADGLTGTAILIRAFRGLGMDARPFTPTRDKDGYGLSRRALENMAEKRIPLLVSVDCGSSDSELIGEFAGRGIESIITDHHLAGELPEALAFVSTQRPSSEYPHSNLSGSAIAYKLAHAFYKKLGRKLEPECWLDFAALGTVGDVMPLVGENRCIVAGGLREIARRMTARKGCDQWGHPAWKALAGRSGLRIGEVSASDLAFRIAPRLNAAGRISDPRLALDILLTDDEAEADRLARELDQINIHRQSLEARLTIEAREQATAQVKAAKAESGGLGILVLAGKNWHPGLVGISSARMVDEFGVPAILLSLDENGAALGSGRGVEGLDLKSLLDGVEEELDRYGGHQRAVGLAVKPGRLDAFREKLQALLPVSPIPTPLTADLAIEPEVADRGFLDSLEKLGPFGEANPEPRILMRGVLPTGYREIRDSHFKLQFETPAGERFEAIAFNGAARFVPRFEKGVESDLLIRLGRDTFRRAPGEYGVSFMLEEFLPLEVSS